MLAELDSRRPGCKKSDVQQRPDRADVAGRALDAGRDGVHLESRRGSASCATRRTRRASPTAIHAGIRRYFYDNPPPGTHVAVLAARERGQALRHVVSPGETLVDVAGRYAVGIDDLRRRNHLETETVASGTILEIPVAGT